MTAAGLSAMAQGDFFRHNPSQSALQPVVKLEFLEYRTFRLQIAAANRGRRSGKATSKGTGDVA
jgi:hypothetical protein